MPSPAACSSEMAFLLNDCDVFFFFHSHVKQLPFFEFVTQLCYAISLTVELIKKARPIMKRMKRKVITACSC